MNRYIFNAGDLVSFQARSPQRGMLGIVRRASYSAYEPKYNRYEVIWLDGQVSDEEAWRLRCEARRSKPSDGPLAHPAAFDVPSDSHTEGRQETPMRARESDKMKDKEQRNE
jgi:hypothetical protein